MIPLISHVTLVELAKTSFLLNGIVSTSPPPPTNNNNTPIPPHSPRQNSETPVLRAITDARSRGYEGVGLPLTTDAWRMRWQNMCLLPEEANTTTTMTTPTATTPATATTTERSRGMSIHLRPPVLRGSDEGGKEREKMGKMDRHTLESKAEKWRLSPCFVKEEVNVSRLDEAEGMIAFVSDWLELDASDDWVRHDAETALLQELAYASYLGIHTAILPSPRHRAQVPSYARAISAALKAIPYMQLSIRIPIYDPSMIQLSPGGGAVAGGGGGHTSEERSSPGGNESTQPSIATWEMWDVIRNVCEYNPRLTLTLDLTPPLPSQLQVLGQWMAEPTRFIFLPATAFHSNPKGYPVLPKGTQSFIRDIMKIQPSVILSGTTAGRHAKGGEAAYAQYIRHLEKTSPAIKAARTAGTVENFAQGYQDYLQAPLQPLMDNLQSMTYNTFEQDPVKYKNYEEAVFRAITEWPRPGKIIICVAGAGRGPLVARCLGAIKRTSRDAVVYAVEKNPNAFVTLQERSHNEWGDRVKLLFGDMRTLEVPESVDILVSELLGSFGDNELSPECLDGAMRFLKPDGISIPASYSAHVAPLSSAKLYNEARATNSEKGPETPYVVMLSSVNILSDDGGGVSGKCGQRIQECWEFEHPRKDPVLNAQGLPMTNSHNVRPTKLVFHIPHAGVLHGLAGYFEAVLYGNIGLSIHPERMAGISKDMLSWFPLFFPFKEPLYLPSNCELHVSIWRLTNEKQVWYEWYAESFLALPEMSLALDSKPQQQQQQQQGSPSSEGGGNRTPPQQSQRSPSLKVVTPTLSVSSAMADEEEGSSGEEKMSVDGDRDGTGGRRLLKIGQTSLHNPGGRSSWIGL